MEVRPGYKQTEIGVIPNEWDVMQVSALVSDFCGGAPLKPTDFTKTGVRVLPKGGFVRGGYLQIAEEDLQFCSPAYAESHPRNCVDRSYTVVVLRDLVPSGPNIGLMVQIRDSETYLLAQGCYGFKTNERLCLAIFLTQLSSTGWYRRLVNSIMVGSTQVHITNTAFKRVQIPVPPIAEQRAIAEALGDADGLLGALEKLIAKKRDLKQAAMQQLLNGKTRLPGFTGEWESASFGSALRKVNAKEYQIQTAEYQTTGIFPVVDQGKDPVVGFSDREDKRFRCPEGGVIVFGDHTCIVKFVDFDFVVGADGTQILAAKVGHSARFHAFHLQHRGIAPTGYNRHFKFLKERSFVAPPLDEQTAIAAVLSDMDAELGALEHRLAKTRALKQGMMQELLTGRTRLV